MPKTILIVDDSRVSRMMIKALLHDLSPGWQVLEAADAEEALKLTDTHKPDAFSLDFNMPGMDGLQLAQDIKSKVSSAKIALFTANIQKAIQEKGEQVGVSFIPKPVTEDSIRVLVEQVCG